MYKCLDCGSVFDESDIKQVEEYMGECHGAPAFEYWNACPFCESYDVELCIDYDYLDSSIP